MASLDAHSSGYLAEPGKPYQPLEGGLGIEAAVQMHLLPLGQLSHYLRHGVQGHYWRAVSRGTWYER
jgi:hypothetical protein